MQLVVVESPAKARTIEKYLGKDYKVHASYGHVRDLPRALATAIVQAILLELELAGRLERLSDWRVSFI